MKSAEEFALAVRRHWVEQKGLSSGFVDEVRRLIESRDSEHAAALAKAEERCRVLEEALTPSESTKEAYMGEFQFRLGEIPTVNVPWVTIKKIMEAIRERARKALEGK